MVQHSPPVAARPDAAIAAGRREEARDLYLRAAAVYRIARYPINRSPRSQQAWERSKAAYEAGGRLLDPPNRAVAIPFLAADPAAGDWNATIQAYLPIPSGSAPADGWPILLFVCGLDAYRTDNTPRIDGHLRHGLAVLSFEIAGTGDCPAAPNDPAAPDRLMTSVVAWVRDKARQHLYQMPYALTAFAHSLEAMEVIRSGMAMSAFQASQQASTSEV